MKAIVAFLMAAAAMVASAATWPLDRQKSSVTFAVTKLHMERVTGTFDDFDGEVQYDPAVPERASIRWRVRVGSVKTGATQRDRNLQTADFFDAERFPELTFASRTVRRLPDGRMIVHGDITIRGVTMPISVEARPLGANAFESSFRLDRLDFGVGGDIAMKHAVSREVDIHLVAAIQASMASASSVDSDWLQRWERAQQQRPAVIGSTARIAPAGEPGTPLVIHGRVVQADGKTPAAGVTVFAYHTDHTGRYNAPGAEGWRLQGWTKTDARGHFEFVTIRPASYPDRRVPAHIHMTIEGPGLPRRSTEGVLFAGDPFLSEKEKHDSEASGEFGNVRPVIIRDGVQHVDLNVRIADSHQF
jgi:polyisoprenoid-binding protein YceI